MRNRCPSQPPGIPTHPTRLDPVQSNTAPRLSATMTPRKTIRVLGLPAILLCAVLAAAAPAPPDDQLSLPQWSKLVWESARQGDRGALETYLSRIPEPADNAQARKVRAALDLHNANVASSLVNRATARDEAMARMLEQLDADEISMALTAAVEVQTLSDNVTAVLDDPAVAGCVQKAKAQIPVARREGDWLYAYELLYRLNVLYEHTGEYEQELDRVNRRLALLTYYAPRQLHELRNRQAARFGEEAIGEFNPAMAEDWKQRLEDIDPKMVKKALETAADNHIESLGWRPLLEGGLEGMRMIATMPALAETYPTLREAEKVKSWLDFVDEKQRELGQTRDRELGIWWCSRALDAIVEKSDETIRLPAEVLYREFGDGAMHDLDQFSEIVWPDKLRRFQQSTHGSFVGVGILIRHDEKRQIMVVSPLEGTPAYFAGVKPGDRIELVDGVSTVGWNLDDAVDKITGRKGSKVELGLRREGVEEIIQLPIVRDVIKIYSVKGWWKKELGADGQPVWDWFIDPDTRIAYIRLTAFNEDSYEDLKGAWIEIVKHGRPNGLILDLRYNPGGLLTSAVDVSNLFVQSGVIVSGETKDGGKAWPDRRAEPNKALIAQEGVPTVVLINQGSASASEIVAGCLQAHGAAIIVGKRSYGKGSVQTVHPISRNAALLKLTTQYYRLPPNADQRAAGEKGNLVHKRPGAEKWGVEPDVDVQTTPKEITAAYDLRQSADIIALGDDGQPQERPDVSRLLTDGLDPQLETALLILQAKALDAPVQIDIHAMAE